jgi:hypothetical protein
LLAEATSAAPGTGEDQPQDLALALVAREVHGQGHIRQLGALLQRDLADPWGCHSSPERAMSNAVGRDWLSESCELVGRFLYHFSRVEQSLDLTLIKIVGLESEIAPVITANIDFARKVELVRTAAVHQLADHPELDFVKKTIGRIFAANEARKIVAHCAFDPSLHGAVQFRRTHATGGRIAVVNPLWPVEKFMQ